MKICLHCEWGYDERANDGDRCMACQARSILRTAGAGSPVALPSHQVLGRMSLHDQPYTRLRYADGSEDLMLLGDLTGPDEEKQ